MGFARVAATTQESDMPPTDASADPYDAARPPVPRCGCGRRPAAAEHDRVAAAETATAQSAPLIKDSSVSGIFVIFICSLWPRRSCSPTACC
jgi:hypothetical protein